MNTSRKGNAKELRSAAILHDDGYGVGSRRHIPGPGDLLAVKPGERPIVAEVKASARPYENFRRGDRAALRKYAESIGAVAVLLWWKPRARSHEWIDESLWP